MTPDVPIPPWPGGDAESFVEHMHAVRQMAFHFHNIGVCVVPAHRDKHPLIEWKRHIYRRMSVGKLASLLARPPMMVYGHGCQLGRLTAPGNQYLIVRDFDKADAYHAWAAGHADLAAACFTVGSRRGYHVYYRSTKRYEKVLFMRDGSGEHRGSRKQYMAMPPGWALAKIRAPEVDGKEGDLLRYEWFQYRVTTAVPETLADIPFIRDPIGAGLLTDKAAENKDDITANPAIKATRKSKTTSIVIYSAEELDRAGNDCRVSVGDEIPDDIRHRVRGAISKHLPTKIGERNHMIVGLVQALYAIDPTRDATAWEPAFDAWWSLARTVVGTQDRKVSWVEFRSAVKNSGPAKRKGHQIAQDAPRTTLKALKRKCQRAIKKMAERGTERLEEVCRQFALEFGDCDGVFHLDERTAGEILGRSHSGARKQLQKLVARGVLGIKPGKSWGGRDRPADSQASRYWFTAPKQDTPPEEYT